jgi:hypothetical protein
MGKWTIGEVAKVIRQNQVEDELPEIDFDQEAKEELGPEAISQAMDNLMQGTASLEEIYGNEHECLHAWMDAWRGAISAKISRPRSPWAQRMLGQLFSGEAKPGVGDELTYQTLVVLADLDPAEDPRGEVTDWTRQIGAEVLLDFALERIFGEHSIPYPYMDREHMVELAMTALKRVLAEFQARPSIRWATKRTLLLKELYPMSIGAATAMEPGYLPGLNLDRQTKKRLLTEALAESWSHVEAWGEAGALYMGFRDIFEDLPGAIKKAKAGDKDMARMLATIAKHDPNTLELRALAGRPGVICQTDFAESRFASLVMNAKEDSEKGAQRQAFLCRLEVECANIHLAWRFREGPAYKDPNPWPAARQVAAAVIGRLDRRVPSNFRQILVQKASGVANRLPIDDKSLRALYGAKNFSLKFKGDARSVKNGLLKQRAKAEKRGLEMAAKAVQAGPRMRMLDSSLAVKRLEPIKPVPNPIGVVRAAARDAFKNALNRRGYWTISMWSKICPVAEETIEDTLSEKAESVSERIIAAGKAQVAARLKKADHMYQLKRWTRFCPVHQFMNWLSECPAAKDILDLLHPRRKSGGGRAMWLKMCPVAEIA